MEIDKYEKAITQKHRESDRHKQYLIGAIAAAVAPDNQASLFRALDDLHAASYEAGRLAGRVQLHVERERVTTP